MNNLEKSALPVSAVAFFLSDLIKHHMRPLLIKGEISNLQKRNFSSYIRFSLKDQQAKIDCLAHQTTNAAKLLQHLTEGDEVIIFAQANYYTKTGQMSFFTEEMMKLGTGLFHSQLEQLKEQLYQEGLFDSSKKHLIPVYPSRIGVITSADGAALQDILRVAQDRYPCIEIFIFPSLVQGKDAPTALCKALSKAQKYSLDAVIIGRGGGSKEDLNAFNNEQLVRLIADSPIPIISAVGHEIDLSLSDYAASASAPTPTAAAMMLLPDRKELIKELKHLTQNLNEYWNRYLTQETIDLKYSTTTLQTSYTQFLLWEKKNLDLVSLQLSESNPQTILTKGYAFLKSDDELTPGQHIELITQKQILTVSIIDIKDRNNE
ncbi:MAG: exodeoxyribonuclease VII large subunit [Brevinemataceae bacterium]